MLSGALQESWVPRAGSAVYFHRQELDRSLEERAVDLLTITAAPRRGEPRQLERYPPDLPLRGEPPRHFPGRPVAFFSARVHPGETPGQFALLGALRLLLSEDPRAAALREAFVFKVVPMLNPDGVARGHYRTNSRGLNLNRHYDAPVRAEHEAVWSVRRLLEYWAETRGERERLLLYVDFHAHATKQGCFFLANRLEGAGQAWNMGYARACQVNSPHFDITACEFAAAGVKEEKKDKDGLGKEGSGRVAIYKCCRLCHAYTLECNYNSGKYVNHTYAPSAAGLPSWAESPGAAAGREAVVPYGAGCWANIGEALCVSLLDMYGHNCCSRLPGSKYGSLVRLVGASHLLGQTPASTARKAPAEILPLALAQLTLDAASEREACCQRGPQCCWGAGPAPGGGSAAARRQSWSGRCRGRGSPCAASVRTVVGRGAQRLQLGTPRQPGLPSRSPSPRRPPPARSPRQGRPPRGGRAARPPPGRGRRQAGATHGQRPVAAPQVELAVLQAGAGGRACQEGVRRLPAAGGQPGDRGRRRPRPRGLAAGRAGLQLEPGAARQARPRRQRRSAPRLPARRGRERAAARRAAEPVVARASRWTCRGWKRC
ncbi:unnamed protein product [Prorocentrum cordatum]|uniref:Peptidase M14 domain-containing protein n=1 Tax=Prorocentrum cordatum TaxID=2364126 RepID=A0ABN9Y6W2_9DINO|nr:unnamed protein product [Polarella glacialis]